MCDRVNLIQGGKITFDKRSDETSADELTEMVVAEYRKALQERRRGSGGVRRPGPPMRARLREPRPGRRSLKRLSCPARLVRPQGAGRRRTADRGG